MCGGERGGGRGVNLWVIRAERSGKDSVFQHIVSASVLFISNGYHSVSRNYQFV